MSDFMDSGERVEGAGGLRIFFRSLRPKENPRAFVVIVPGFNAHSRYYAWTAEQFVAMGLAVDVVDLRGRGNSDGERFYVENFEDYVSDVEAVVKVAKSRESGSPFFVLGHSAGGVVACVYALDHPAELAGLICESFAHELPISLSLFSKGWATLRRTPRSFTYRTSGSRAAWQRSKS